MTLPFTREVRRLTCLFVAERALRAGAPERALVSLAEPVVAGSGRARKLRERALRELAAKACRRAAGGRDRSAGRLLALLASEDWTRAQECRDRLQWIAEASRGEGLGSGRTLSLLRRRAGGTPDAPRRPAPPPPAAREAGMSGVLRMSVDDGGEWLWVEAPRVVVGHAHGGRADLPFLADVGVRHAELQPRESLREGCAWRVAALDGEEVRLDGARVEGEARLTDGARLDLGENLSLAVRYPDPASATCVLDFLRGAECLGASHALLVAPGERVSFGPTRVDHVLVASARESVQLARAGAVLEVFVEGRLDATIAPGSEPLALPRRDAAGPPLEVRWAPSGSGGGATAEGEVLG